MIYAEKIARFRWLFKHYQEKYLIPKNFHSLYYAGEIDSKANYPTLYMANHCSWWDGILLFQVLEQLSKKEHYIMMEEKQLSHYRFFSKLGAFSVDKDRLSEIRKSFRYAEELMNTEKAVWMFPQGGIFHQEQRPLQFQRGAEFLLTRFEKSVVKPVSLHYSFNQYQKPTASILFGDEIIIHRANFNKGELTLFLEKQLEHQLEDHRKKVIENVDFQGSMPFLSLLKTGKSTSDYFDIIKKGLSKWSTHSS